MLWHNTNTYLEISVRGLGGSEIGEGVQNRQILDLTARRWDKSQNQSAS